jgi:4-amino-4-deoxy-L-arabinose transferase-like glycosyltransferase
MLNAQSPKWLSWLCSAAGRAAGSAAGIVILLSVLKFAVHLLAAGNYGLFIDELYFLATSEHLAWGYVDMPPGAALLAWLARRLFGETVFGLHLLPALLGAALILLTGLLVRLLGGGRYAQLIAGLGVFFANANWLAYSYLSMNALEPLIWLGCVIILVRLIQTEDPRWWLAFGLLAGLGLLNKHTMLGFGFGLLVGVLVSPARKHLWNRWLFLGGALAALIFLPNLLWNIQYGFPILELQANIRQSGRNVQLSPLQFLLEQVVFMNPAALPIWLGGLGWVFFHPQGKTFRFMGWGYLITLGLLLVTHGRTYYLAPAYPMLFAAGGMLAESLWRRLAAPSPLQKSIFAAYPILLVVLGAIQVPLYLPVLAPETYIAYSQALHLRAPKLENFDRTELPQLFADRFGWPEMADLTAEVYQSLPPEEQAVAAILGNNYGQAGAIDFYGPALGLPKAISGHQNYYLWGTRGYTGEVVIALGYQYDFLIRYFASVQPTKTFQHLYAMVYEFFPIYVCRQPRAPLEQVWVEFKTWR